MSRRNRRIGALLVVSALASACSNGSLPDGLGAAAPTSTVAPVPTGAASSVPPTTAAATSTTAATAGNGEAGSTSTVTTVSETSTTAPTSTTTSLPTLDVALTTLQSYVGGTVGTAATTDAGTVAIGWVNQEGGTPSFSDATTGLAAAVAYINQHLGGIGGRQIDLHTCAIQRAADGARCAEQMKNDAAISVVIVGPVTLGNKELLDGLRDVKPVVLAAPLTTADYLATDAVAYTPGSPGIINGLARLAAGRLPSGVPAKVAVVYPFGLAGEAAYQLLAKPALDAAAVASVPVAVLEGADPADYASVVTAAGAADANVFLPILGVRGCIGVDQAIRDLSSTASVLVTDACLGPAMTNWLAASGRTGDLPEGWYVGGTGFRFGVGDDPAAAAYLRVVSDYVTTNALTPLDLTTYAPSAFGALVTVVRLANGLGPDAITPEAMRTATRGFAGPMWDVVGSMSCGFNPFYPSLCGTQMGVQQYRSGRLEPYADGYTGGSIDLTASSSG